MNKVVIIDDSMVVRKIVETTFRRAGIDCTSYSDGVEALQALKDWQDELPDLIFLEHWPAQTGRIRCIAPAEGQPALRPDGGHHALCSRWHP